MTIPYSFSDGYSQKTAGPGDYPALLAILSAAGIGAVGGAAASRPGQRLRGAAHGSLYGLGGLGGLGVGAAGGLGGGAALGLQYAESPGSSDEDLLKLMAMGVMPAAGAGVGAAGGTAAGVGLAHALSKAISHKTGVNPFADAPQPQDKEQENKRRRVATC